MSFVNYFLIFGIIAAVVLTPEWLYLIFVGASLGVSLLIGIYFLFRLLLKKS